MTAEDLAERILGPLATPICWLSRPDVDPVESFSTEVGRSWIDLRFCRDLEERPALYHFVASLVVEGVLPNIGDTPAHLVDSLDGVMSLCGCRMKNGVTLGALQAEFQAARTAPDPNLALRAFIAAHWN